MKWDHFGYESSSRLYDNSRVEPESWEEQYSEQMAEEATETDEQSDELRDSLEPTE